MAVQDYQDNNDNPIYNNEPENDWFVDNAPPPEPEPTEEPAPEPTPQPTPGTFTPPWDGYGLPPNPYQDYQIPGRPSWLQGEYVPPARPEYLRGEYRAPQWSGGDFAPPSMADVQNEPGYALGLQSGIDARQRSAAAQGSILSGGTQKALTRFGTDYGATKYGESFNRAFDTYKQRYGQFMDSANLSLQARGVNETAYQNDVGRSLAARGINETAYQNDVGNSATEYSKRYTNYLDAVNNRRTAEEDWYRRFVENPTEWGLQATIAGGNG